MLSFLRSRRRATEAWLTKKGRAHAISLQSFLLYREIRARLEEVNGGRCLDAGAGRSPLKEELKSRGVQVMTVDVEDRGGGVDFIADIQNMPVITDASMDYVLCTQVLEHIPRPGDALDEFMRVLKPGGMLVLSVPHLSVIHEAPHDFFRFTRYGLNSLLSGAGFGRSEIDEAGGLVAFLLHPVSVLVVAAFGSVPGFRSIAWWLNYTLFVRLMTGVDRLAGLRSIYPNNYVVTAWKAPIEDREKPTSGDSAR